MATLLSRSTWVKFLLFRKQCPFSRSKRIHIGFFYFKFETNASKLTPVPNFIQIGQKIRELKFRPGTIPKTAWWPHTCLIVMKSANILWFLRDFVPEYYHTEFGGNWTTNKGERGGDIKQPRLNRVWNIPGLGPFRALSGLATFRAQAYMWDSVYSKAKTLTILLFSLIHRRNLVPSVKQVWRSSSQTVKQVWRHVRFFNDSAETQKVEKLGTQC